MPSVEVAEGNVEASGSCIWLVVEFGESAALLVIWTHGDIVNGVNPDFQRVSFGCLLS